ncbi:efflux RND transporter permease subunit [Aestuariirhabdus litorea]|uniref:Efflux RND transporter permease subunit n=1 Tax=Aestuariirhabdus litorea TaxID=2528527 RepID=A0A3P3VPC8_9GAMM|nr:efflux RND transporter permease subunit [Aestuariirhabdus litorea]RRJ84565.1 efflux RND transporter permease subunit [Aestuariirhabdus litorea]RWW97791.1 efflux RND transporter permease subunit [Endozoicomonadaceae bacterium GTF-13]
MNIAEFSITRRISTWLFVVILGLGGVISFEKLGRLEDPVYVIKEAKIITHYPGASPTQVEEEVTFHIENAVQLLPQLKRVESISQQGYSEVRVTIQDHFNEKTLPQVWDELRRKVRDITQLPPGASEPLVWDAYGDVFGMFYAITGSGYSNRELKDFAKVLQRDLLMVPGVAKVQYGGVLGQRIFVDMSRDKLSQLGITPNQIAKTLSEQNLLTDSGRVRVDNEFLVINPSGEFNSPEEIGALLIKQLGAGPAYSQTIEGLADQQADYRHGAPKLIHLDDVATVSLDYDETPTQIIRHNAEPALTLSVAVQNGVNVIDVGRAIQERIRALRASTPAGIEIHPVYEQSVYVERSVEGFLVSLSQALGIVILVLLIFMGPRSGLLIGAILLLTVSGTLLVMYITGIDLQRISLGGLIIALGMLVDNAIVVTEGIMVRMQRGQSALKAAKTVVDQTLWPLFGATLVGIFAFAPIGLSPDKTGAYCNTLFWVIFISLMLSWYTAVAVAPLFCHLILKRGGAASEAAIYDHPLYRGYRAMLVSAIRFRWLTLLLVVCLLAAAIVGFRYLKQGFFPDSNTPIFYIDYWRAEGTDIRATSDDLKAIERYLLAQPEVVSVTTSVGRGVSRFLLVYAPKGVNSSYGQLIVKLEDNTQIGSLIDRARLHIAETFPDSEPKFQRVRLGPGRDSKIEVRFSGPDPRVLRELSSQAKEIMWADSNADNVRDDWRQQTKVLVPLFNEVRARQAGVSRPDLTSAIKAGFEGRTVGTYRDGTTLLPIVIRAVEAERNDISNIAGLQVWSPTLNRPVPIQQVVDGFETHWQDPIIKRRDRVRTLTASCDPREGQASTLLNRLRPQIEAIDLPPGYRMEWGGEFEDSSDARKSVFKFIPLGILAMLVTVILLFNAIKQPLIIWLCVPLSVTGVSAALLLSGQPFGFMALLGFLSLSGMLIKNAIVLLEQIDLEIKEGKEPYRAVVDSSVSRVRPVMMAALTTVLGMIPLVYDVFFSSMAVTIMGGLSFATLLTLIVVPVLYTLFFGIPASPRRVTETAA